MKRNILAMIVSIILLVSFGAQPAFAANTFVNGSFETQDYTGWTLMEYYQEEEEEQPVESESGTFGIAADGQTISYNDTTYDFHDQVIVIQQSMNLPITYNATDGDYLAYTLTNGPETFRMYQDINLDESAANLTWDMMYQNLNYAFDPDWQYLAVNVRDTDDNMLGTLFKTTNSTDPHSINMTSFSRDISAYGNQTIRLDIELREYDNHFDSAFDNFGIVGGTNVLVNGSFETQDYTGWTLMEYYEEEEPDDSECGTFGIAANGETINYADSTYDFCDAVNVTQLSMNLPITYNATDGDYLAYILTNCEQTHRMYQDITLDGSAQNLTWDMMYLSDCDEFHPVQQYLAVNIRDTDDNILETLFKTTDGADPYSINMTSFSGDISTYANQTIRLDIEERNYWCRLDSAFDNFAVVGGTNLIDNGSFETQDYTGWTLMQYYDPLVLPEDGTFGIAMHSQTIYPDESTWDFHDGLNVTQTSLGLPITYNATDGDYLAYILVNGPENLRMYQDITLDEFAANLTWDMMYENHEYEFDPVWQYLAVNVRDTDDNILETLFKTTDGADPYSINMTSFSRDISAYAGETIRIDIEQSQYWFYFDSAFDNFAISSEAGIAPTITAPPESTVVAVGDSAHFEVAYTASPAPSVQWQVSTNGGKKWKDIVGATSDSYDTPSTITRMDGNLYRVILDNGIGDPVISEAATLTVVDAPSLVVANVSVTKNGTYNGTITWTITVSNSGPDTAQGIEVQDRLARGTRFDSITSDNITGISELTKVHGRNIIVSLGELDNGKSVQFDITVSLTRATLPVENSVTVTTTTYDPDMTNNSDTFTMAV